MTGRRRHGDGSIFRYRDGYAAVVEAGWSDGKRRRRWLYGRTQADVQRQLNEARSLAAQGVNLAAPPTNLSDWLDEWLLMKERAGTRPSTLRGYQWLIESHLRPSLGKQKMTKITPTMIRRLLEQKSGDGLSTGSVRHIHGLLRNVLADAEREELLHANPARLVRPPALRRPERRALTVPKAKHLVEVVRGHRLEALWICALSLGLRRGELLGLRWIDVDFDAETVAVRQTVLRVGGRLEISQPKTQKSARLIPAPAVILNQLRTHRARQLAEQLKVGPRWTDSGLVFTSTVGTPLEPRNVDRAWHALRATADLDWLRLHDLRHACATFMLLSGASPRTVMQTLGHSQIGLTMNTYAHFLPDIERAAVTEAARILFGEGGQT